MADSPALGQNVPNLRPEPSGLYLIPYVWRISAVLNKKQKSIIVSDPLYAPVLPASPTSTRGLTQPRIFFRYLQDFGNPIV